MIETQKLQGLVAATFTPFSLQNDVDLNAIPRVTEHLIDQGIAGLYVLGTTGEGLSLTEVERRQVAESYVTSAAGRVPVIVQVGSDSLRQSRALAEHAEEIGADAVSAVSPLYFRPRDAELLTNSMAEIAAGAPSLPFYYYHVPSITAVEVDLVRFCELAVRQIPSFRGVKYTASNVEEFTRCLNFDGDKLDVLWGTDELLLIGLQAGAKAAIGSTYNFAAPLYLQLWDAFRRGDIPTAKMHQSKAQELVTAFCAYGHRAAQKALMELIGVDCGPTRLPIPTLSPDEFASLRRDVLALKVLDIVQVDDSYQSPHMRQGVFPSS